MRRTGKVFLILFFVGLLGVAVTLGVIVGTGMLRSYEGSKTYPIAAPVTSAKIEASHAQVLVVPTEGDYRVEAYAKAWLERPIDMDTVLSVSSENGVLTVTETPFPAEFLGLFPQPYELLVTLYLPREICDTL